MSGLRTRGAHTLHKPSHTSVRPQRMPAVVNSHTPTVSFPSTSVLPRGHAFSVQVSSMSTYHFWRNFQLDSRVPHLIKTARGIGAFGWLLVMLLNPLHYSPRTFGPFSAEGSGPAACVPTHCYSFGAQSEHTYFLRTSRPLSHPHCPHYDGRHSGEPVAASATATHCPRGSRPHGP